MMRAIPAILLTAVALPALGQASHSSSLYVEPAKPAMVIPDPFETVVVNPNTGEVAVRSDKQPNTISREVRQVSYAAVVAPEPKLYKKHDLVTIIVRESTTAAIDASLETEKDASWTGEIAEFPKINLADLLNLQLRPNTFPEGTPKLDVRFGSDFEGEGDYEHNTEMTARLAARVIDVKPNGLLVLEARKFVENDEETMTFVVTGTCSVDAIEIDNTVVSSDLYDLHISKQHTGQLRKSTKKGLLTNIMEFLFNF